MIGVTCLAKDTQLQQDLKDIVEYVAYDRIAKGKDANVGTIYNIIRKSGIEIDLQSIGHIYNESLDKNYQEIMSDDQVNDFVLTNYKDAIRRAALLEQKEPKEQQIGQDAPEIYLTNGILNMFYNTEVPNEDTKSDMLKMQNALWKGIQRKLKLPEKQKPQTQQEWKDILGQALGYEQLGLRDLNGRLNSISDLYNAMRDQLDEAMSEAKQQADPATYERLQEMVKQLEASTYSLLFSKGEAKILLDEMMKKAGFGKQLKNGKTILDWNKLAGGIGSVQDVRENVEKVLSDNGFSPDVIEGVKDSLENEFNEFQTRILEKAENELSKRNKAIDREPSSKSDLRRLAELNNLGIFESTHDRVLYNLLNVGELQQEDIENIKKIAQAASNLYKKIDEEYGSKSEIFASREFQSMQRLINSVIEKNVSNKNFILKAISIINNYFTVHLTGLLANAFTILENKLSGVKEAFVPVITGKGFNKEDLDIYRSMMSDVVARGQAYGEEIGSFAPKELYINTLKWNWNKDASKKEKAESLLYAATIPARVGLLAFDSANKVVLTNKIFKNAIYSVLVQRGMNKEDALNLMNEALYGQSFKDAKEKAKEILESVNKDLPEKLRKPVNNNTITVLANDLVKANLNANGAISNEVIEAAYKSSYHVAGYGLGHEPNNILSRGIKGLRTIMATEDARLVTEKKWKQLAFHRLLTSLTNNMIIRFTGGATNWLYLRAQSAGVGLLTGFIGKWVHGTKIDFDSTEKIKESIKEIQNDRNQIGRAVVGLSYAAIWYMIGYALVGGRDDEDEENKLKELNKRKDELNKINSREYDGGASEKAEKISQIDKEITKIETSTSILKQIKNNWMASRLFRKTAPDLMLLQYYIATEKNEYLGAFKYVQNTYGLGDQYSLDAKATEAGRLYWKGDIDAGNGMLSSALGDKFGVPFWRAGKDYYKLGKWIGGGKVSSDFEAPHNFVDGLIGGGMLEDLGFYDKNPAITILPGIGSKTYEKFKEKGIKNMSDLKGNWWETTFQDENGNDKYILNATDRIKAREAAENYKKEK